MAQQESTSMVDFMKQFDSEENSMGKCPSHGHAVFVACSIVGQDKRKAPVFTQGHGIGAGHFRANIKDRLAGFPLIGDKSAVDLHADKILFGTRVFLHKPDVLLITGDSFFQPGNGFRVFPQHHILQRIFLAQVAGFEYIQLADLHIQIALFNDKGIAGGQRLDFGVA